MEVHKKFGTIIMVFSVVLWFVLISLAEDRCDAGAAATTSTLKWLSVCVRLVLDRETPDAVYVGVTYIQGTYLALACFVIFAVGFLWYRNALPVPTAVRRYLSSDSQ